MTYKPGSSSSSVRLIGFCREPKVFVIIVVGVVVVVSKVVDGFLESSNVKMGIGGEPENPLLFDSGGRKETLISFT